MATTKNPPTIVTCTGTAQDLTLETNVVRVLVRNRDATNSAGIDLKTSSGTDNPGTAGENAIVLKPGQEVYLEANGNTALAYINQGSGSPKLEIIQFVQA
jgi:hypothetical protein